MVDLLAVDGVRPHALGDQGLGLNRPTRRADPHHLGVANAQFLGVLRADLHEQFRLQLSQPGEPAAHAAAEVMFGETVGRENVRILLRAHRSEHLLRLPDFRHRVALLGVDRILHR